MSALGVPIQVDRDQALSRFQFYLGLADALNCKQHLNSAHLKELADSFSHDVLNIAALAGRLLWYEGVTPIIWRSHDLISVSVDAEAYYVMLQSACDIMADVIATLGAKKNQAPWDSFHKLNEWALKNPKRLDRAYHLVAASLSWFKKINSARTRIVHRGQTMLVYTDRVTFNWGRLITNFRDLTNSMLNFSERLGSVVMSRRDREENSQKTVIDGVYVPALRHLLYEYAVPKRSKSLKCSAQCLLACGGYVEAAYLGYPNGFWWKVLVSSCARMASELTAASIPVSTSGSVHDCKFALSDGKKRFGLVACDYGRREPAWFEGAADSAKRFELEYGTQRTVFVVRVMKGTCPQFLPGTRIPLIVGTAPSAVSGAIAAAMLA